MANNTVSPSRIINYISQRKKIVVGRNNQPNQQLVKFDYRLTDTYNFQIINQINQIVSIPSATTFELYGSFIDAKQQSHLLFYTSGVTADAEDTLTFVVDTYTSEYLNQVKTQKEIDLSIVATDADGNKSMTLRDKAIAYPRPYIEGRTPTEIVQQTIYVYNAPVTGSFSAGSGLNMAPDINTFAFGEGLYTNTENQVIIGSYNDPEGTTNQAFVIGNGDSDSDRSNAFTIDYEGNVSANSISAVTFYINGESVATEGDLATDLAATSAWANDTFETKTDAFNSHNTLDAKIDNLRAELVSTSGAIEADIPTKVSQLENDVPYLSAHQSLDGYATEQWVKDQGYLTGVDLTDYATKNDLALSTANLNYQISQVALDIPTKVTDLSDAGNYALKTDIPTDVATSAYVQAASGNAVNAATGWVLDQGYITGIANNALLSDIKTYTGGTGIAISDQNVISLTGDIGQTYTADEVTLQLSGNQFSIKSLATKLKQGVNVYLGTDADGAIIINAIGGSGGEGATYLAGTGLSLSTVTPGSVYSFDVNEAWLSGIINEQVSGVQTLSAGEGLKIENNVISLTATIPSVDGLASEEWVEEHFLSAIPDTYATKEYVAGQVSGKADLNSVYTKEEVYTYLETDAKINQATSGKADKTTVENLSTNLSAAITGVIDTLSTKADISALSDYTTSAQVSSIVEEYGFATTGELEGVSGELVNALGNKANTADLSAYATSAWVDQNYMKSGDVPTDVYTKTEVNEISAAISGAVSGAGYLTEIPTSYVQNTTLETVSAAITAQIPNSGSVIDVATGAIPTNVGAFTNDVGYLTAHQSLDDYYTKTEADNKFLTAHQSLDDYYNKTQVNAISTALSSTISTNYALKTDVPTSVYQIATAGSGITISEQGEIALVWNTLPSAVSQLINDTGYLTQAELPEGTVYFAGDGLKKENNTFYLTGTVLSGDGSTIQIVDNVISAIGGGTTYTAGNGIAISDQNVISLTASIPLSTSELTNDSGFITSSDLPSTVYDKLSAGANITLSKNDQTGVTTINSTGGSQLIAGNKIRLTETAQGTRIDVIDHTITTENQTFNFDLSNGSQTSSLIYNYDGSLPVTVTFSDSLPNGITFANDEFTATDAPSVEEGTTILSATISTDDAYAVTAQLTFIITGHIQPEITVDTIPQMNFTYSDSGVGVTSSMTEYVTYTGQETLDYQLSGTLPSAISFANGTFTCIPSGIVSSEYIDVNVLLSASDVASTAIAPVALSTYKEETPPTPSPNTPLTFTGKSSTNAIQLNQPSNFRVATVQYNLNGNGWQQYSFGTIIEFNQDETVAFSGANEAFSHDSSNLYKFNMSGEIDASGNIMALLNFSEDCPSSCFRGLFQDCTSLKTPPSLPATGLAIDCYWSMFQGAGITSVPEISATTLANNCCRSMFRKCYNMSGKITLPATTLAENCYYQMLSYCTSLQSIDVSFTEWSPSNATSGWVDNIGGGEQCTFYKPSSLSPNTGNNYIPSNWTVVNK